MFTVYILYSDNFKKHYTGYSSNFEERYKSHNEFGKDWTMRYRPWRIIYTKVFANKVEAIGFEKWLKTGVGRDFIKRLEH